MAEEPRGQFSGPGPTIRQSDEPTIRTMKTDTEQLLKKEKTSFLEMFAQGSDARYDKGYHPTPIRSRSYRGVVVTLIIISIVSAAIGGFYLYTQKQASIKPTPQTVTLPRSVINVATTEKIQVKNADRTGLLLALENKQKSSTREPIHLPITITNTNSPERLATPKDFFTTLRIDLPQNIYENFTGTWNTYSEAGGFIFLFEIKNRLTTLGTMLDFEETMPQTLGPIIGRPDIGLRQFRDVIIKNVDARITRPSDTDPTTWGYSIVLGKYLVITTNETGLKDIVERIVAGPINE